MDVFFVLEIYVFQELKVKTINTIFISNYIIIAFIGIQGVTRRSDFYFNQYYYFYFNSCATRII